MGSQAWSYFFELGPKFWAGAQKVQKIYFSRFLGARKSRDARNNQSRAPNVVISGHVTRHVVDFLNYTDFRVSASAFVNIWTNPTNHNNCDK